MYPEVVLFCCVCLVLLDSLSAAPIHKKHRSLNTRDKRRDHGMKISSGGTEFFIEFNEDTSDTAIDFLDGLMSEDAPSRNKRLTQAAKPSKVHKRSKRNVLQEGTTVDEEKALMDDIMNFGMEEETNYREKRKRRSAAFILHAALELCKKDLGICGVIHMSENDMKLSIRIADM